MLSVHLPDPTGTFEGTTMTITPASFKQTLSLTFIQPDTSEVYSKIPPLESE